MDGKYFKIDNRYYYAQSLQFQQGTPDADLGAVILDVTGLPDASKVKEVARIRYPASPGGFHNTFAYKHSDGRALYFATIEGSKALVYDLEKIVKGGDPSTWLIGAVPNPTPMKQIGAGGYHDFYVGYDPATKKDKFYGAGLGGYSVWDVTKPEAPTQEFTITSLGLDLAHTFTPSPDGRYAVTETEYQYSPLRIWDLQDGQSGKTENIDQPISAWTADLRALSHNHEVRWPFVFVSGYEDGLQIFSLEDPEESEDARPLLHLRVRAREGLRRLAGERLAVASSSVMQGAFGVDVRNYDGLVVDQRHAHRALDLQVQGLRRLERARPRHAEHFERAGLGSRADRAGPAPLITYQVRALAPGRPHARGVGHSVHDPTPRHGHGADREGHGAPAVRGVALRHRRDRGRSRELRRAIRAVRLPEPASLGRYTAYVAWMAATDLGMWHRLGTVRNGTTVVGQAELNKFLFVITAEADSLASARKGPTILHGPSPSTWLQNMLTHPMFRGIPPG